MVKTKQEDFDLNKVLKPYLKHWPWFILSCILFLTLAFFYLRYATPEYNAYAKIMLTHEEGVSSPAGSVLKDLGGGLSGGEKVIEDEIEILRSRKLMKGVVDRLDLNLRIFSKGSFHDTQFFPNSKAPIKISFIESDSIINQSNFGFSLVVKSGTDFDFTYARVKGENEITVKKSFGKNIDTPIGDIVITPNILDISNFEGKTLVVKIVSVNEMAEAYKRRVIVSPADEFSKVINLSLDDSSIARAKAVINTLVDEYNRTSIEEKNTKANNTADFIDTRIGLIATDLAEVDDEIEQFKTGNKLTDITSEAELYLNTSAQTEQDLAASQTEYNMMNYMKDQINDDDFSPIPSNVGLTDTSVNNMAMRYNELLTTRDRLLKSSNEKNPIVVNLDQEILNLKNGLRQSLENSAKATRLRIRSLERQSAQISSRITAVPGQVRKSRDIEREQGVKESLYLFLLQKREEATISLRSTAPGAKIIDEAHSDGMKVKPKALVTYLASIMFGLCIPFGFLYLKDVLDDKIHNKEDLETIIQDIPVLGEIPRISGKNSHLIKKNDRSILSESFRIVRTNLDYIRRKEGEKKYGNVIFVTSTINGEGKSYFSLNMALTMASTTKKVLLIGADIRNPQIYAAINNKKNSKSSKIGLTEYLVDKSIMLEDTINSYQVNDIEIDVLLSGKIPPNPAELLMDERVEELFDAVSESYDYVIVDTAPSMLVTDTLLISDYAGHTIYLTRADRTEKKILNFAKELHYDNKLKGMMLVVNDVNQSNFGYGAKYGYYGTPAKKGLFSSMKV